LVVVVVLTGGETSFVKKSLKGRLWRNTGRRMVQRGKVSTSRGASQEVGSCTGMRSQIIEGQVCRMTRTSKEVWSCLGSRLAFRADVVFCLVNSMKISSKADALSGPQLRECVANPSWE
jgi:predicted metal-dependent enzyme (double-stranded beta helix superfamily)